MRSARVDLLRGLAIFAVLALHFSLAYNLADSPLALLLPAPLIRAAVLNGNYGVTVFFVISGFLITSNNLSRYGTLDRVRLPHFYGLRAARILPPLFVALAIILLLGLLNVPFFANDAGDAPRPGSLFLLGVLSVLTFWHNVLMEWVGYFNYCLNIYWSLSVEEVFYLTFPIACVFLRRRWLIEGLCWLCIAGAPLYRFAHADDELYYMYGYLACFDAIAIGCLTALAYRSSDYFRHVGRVTRIVAAVGLAATWLVGFDGHEAFGFTVVALCAAILLSNAFEPGQREAGNPFTRLLGWFGRHSYELYLFHIVILATLRNLVPRGTLGYGYKLPVFALFVAGSAALAALVARFIAEPTNGWLRSWLGPNVAPPVPSHK